MAGKYIGTPSVPFAKSYRVGLTMETIHVSYMVSLSLYQNDLIEFGILVLV